MIDMAEAFGVLANLGVRVPLTAILHVEDYQGRVLYDVNVDNRKQVLSLLQDNPDQAGETFADGSEAVRVLQPAPAYLVTEIMRDDRARWLGFGSRSELVIPDKDVAVKTGTTNDVKDNWTIGFTSELLTVVWVGNADGSAMNSALVSGVTGAAPIWNKIMRWLLAGQEIKWLELDEEEEVKTDEVCWTGMPDREVDQVWDEEGNLMPGECGERKREIYWTAGAPARSGVREEAVFICTETGLPPKDEENAPCGETQVNNYLVARDPLLDFYCVNCPRPVNEEGRVVSDPYYRISEAQAVAQYGD
jgi:membrane peptidoglycan carboxypeptidase